MIRSVTVFLACSAIVLGKELPFHKPTSRKFLDSIRIPEVTLMDDTDLQLVLHDVLSRALELDTVGAKAPQRGFSAIIRLSQKKDWDAARGGFDELPADLRKVKIDYRARGVTLTTFLKEVARQAHLDLHVTSIGVVFCRPGLAPFPTANGNEGEVFETLFKQPEQPVKTQEGEQDGAGQPATRPESKPEGSDKPQPEAEERSP